MHTFSPPVSAFAGVPAPSVQAEYAELVRKLAGAGDLGEEDAVRLEEVATALGKNAVDVADDLDKLKLPTAKLSAATEPAIDVGGADVAEDPVEGDAEDETITQAIYEAHVVKVAYHEAGHGIMFLACGGDVTEIITTVSRQGGGVCCGNYRPGVELDAFEAMVRAAFDLAGGLAEMLCKVKPERYADYFDFGDMASIDDLPASSQDAELLSAICTVDGGSDESNFEEHAAILVAAGESLEVVRDRATDLALMVLTSNRWALDSLAAELIMSRRLNGKEAAAIVCPRLYVTGEEAYARVMQNPAIGRQLRLEALTPPSI